MLAGLRSFSLRATRWSRFQPKAFLASTGHAIPAKQEAEWQVGQLLQISGSYWQTCTLHAAVKLGVFTAIGKDGCTVEHIASKLGADARATDMLCSALSAMKLLVKTENTFQNANGSWKLLSKDSDDYIGFMIMHHHNLMEGWAQLAEVVESGHSLGESSSSTTDPARREAFLMGMYNNAMALGPLIVPKMDMTNCKHLLDLGGGPGTYALQFCKRHPALTATIFDLPTTEPFANKTIEQFGLSDRVKFLGGDFLKDDFGVVPYDCAWLSHILHGENPTVCQEIIRKTAAGLQPGGKLLIHEFILSNERDGPLFPALFSLNMLLMTQGGQAYSEGQLRHVMQQAGIQSIERVPLKVPNDSGVLVGIK